MSLLHIAIPLLTANIGLVVGTQTTLKDANLSALVACPLEVAAEPTDEISIEKDLKELLKLTNEERAKAGVPALTINSKLEAAAKMHSRNMAKQEMMEHELDGKGPADRVKEQEYKFRALAENIAERQKTPAEAIKSWMDSEGHRTNLLNKEYTEIGVGCAESAKGVRYWTQVFGKPKE